MEIKDGKLVTSHQPSVSIRTPSIYLLVRGQSYIPFSSSLVRRKNKLERLSLVNFFSLQDRAYPLVMGVAYLDLGSMTQHVLASQNDPAYYKSLQN
jgi:hypothetical protein